MRPKLGMVVMGLLIEMVEITLFYEFLWPSATVAIIIYSLVARECDLLNCNGGIVCRMQVVSTPKIQNHLRLCRQDLNLVPGSYSIQLDRERGEAKLHGIVPSYLCK